MKKVQKLGKTKKHHSTFYYLFMLGGLFVVGIFSFLKRIAI